MTQCAQDVKGKSEHAAIGLTQFIGNWPRIKLAENEEKPRKITVRLTEEEFAAFDQLRARLGTKFQAVGLELFKQWLARGGREAGSSHAGNLGNALPATGDIPGLGKTEYTVANPLLSDPDHAMLARIKASGISLIQTAIRDNLRSFDALREIAESLEANNRAKEETDQRPQIPARFREIVASLRRARGDEDPPLPGGKKAG